MEFILYSTLLIIGAVIFLAVLTKPKKHSSDLSQTKKHHNISEYIDYLEQRLGMPFLEFRVQNFEYYFDRLTYEAHDPGAVASVTDQVLRHYRLDPSKVRIETVFWDHKSEINKNVRGQFYKTSANYGKVQIILKPENSEFDTVISIIMHECAHYFSEIHHTKLDNEEENERLTDVTAIWLGAGKKMLRGCFPSENIRVGYLTKDECQYAISETERRRQIAINKSEKFRHQFTLESNAQTSGIDMASRALELKALCGEENQEKLQILKGKCKRKQEQATRILQQLEHAMSKHAYCEMNAQLLQTSQITRKELDSILDEFKVFQALTMEGLHIDEATYAHYVVISEYAQAGNIFSQFEMLKFYNAHPSTIASDESKYLIDKLEKSAKPHKH